MCHSVEMYLPKITHVSAEQAMRADLAAARRERRAMGALGQVLALGPLRRLLARLRGPVAAPSAPGQEDV